MKEKEIFASEERQKILDMYGIKYCTDQDLNFFFKSESEKKKAIKILKAHLVL